LTQVYTVMHGQKNIKLYNFLFKRTITKK